MDTTPTYQLPFLEDTDLVAAIVTQSKALAETFEERLLSGDLRGVQGIQGVQGEPGPNAVPTEAYVASAVSAAMAGYLTAAAAATTYATKAALGQYLKTSDADGQFIGTDAMPAAGTGYHPARTTSDVFTPATGWTTLAQSFQRSGRLVLWHVAVTRATGATDIAVSSTGNVGTQVIGSVSSAWRPAFDQAILGGYSSGPQRPATGGTIGTSGNIGVRYVSGALEPITAGSAITAAGVYTL